MVPPNSKVWFTYYGVEADAPLEVRRFGPGDEDRLLALDEASGLKLDVIYPQSSGVRLYRASLMGLPSSEYVLRYSAGEAVTRRVSLRTSAAPVSLPPNPPTISMGYYSSMRPPDLITSCAGPKANESAFVFVTTAPGTALIRAWARYSDGSETSPHRLLTASEDEAQPSRFTFWAADKGLPCVVAVAIGPSGLESTEVEVCEPVGCTDEFRALYWQQIRWARQEGCGTSEAAPPQLGCTCARSRTQNGLLWPFALLIALTIRARGRGTTMLVAARDSTS